MYFFEAIEYHGAKNEGRRERDVIEQARNNYYNR